MTRDEKIAEAKRLKAQDLSHRQIGERLGVSGSAIWKWLHPEQIKEMDRRTSQRRRAEIRAWEREHSTPCPECGERLIQSFRRSRPPERCGECGKKRKHEQARKKTARWLAMRREGMNNYEIAELENVTTPAVANLLQRRRVARFPELKWLPAPYAAARKVAA